MATMKLFQLLLVYSMLQPSYAVDAVTVHGLIDQRWPGIDPERSQIFVDFFMDVWQRVDDDLDQEAFLRLASLEIAGWSDPRGVSTPEAIRKKYEQEESIAKMARAMLEYPGVESLTEALMAKEMEAHRLTVTTIRRWLREAPRIRLDPDARFGPHVIYNAVRRLRADAVDWFPADGQRSGTDAMDDDLVGRWVLDAQDASVDLFDRKFQEYFRIDILQPRDALWRIDHYEPLGDDMPARAARLQEEVFKDLPAVFESPFGLISYYVRPKSYILGYRRELDGVREAVRTEKKPDKQYIYVDKSGRLITEIDEPEAE